MKRYPGLYFLMVIAGAFFIGAALTSCSPDKTAPEFTPSEDAMSEPTVSDDVMESVPVDDNSLDTVTGGVAVADATFTDFVCLDCHSNQELLQELAVEEESTESLSEGPG